MAFSMASINPGHHTLPPMRFTYFAENAEKTGTRFEFVEEHGPVPPPWAGVSVGQRNSA